MVSLPGPNLVIGIDDVPRLLRRLPVAAVIVLTGGMPDALAAQGGCRHTAETAEAERLFFSLSLFTSPEDQDGWRGTVSTIEGNILEGGCLRRNYKNLV